MMQAKAESEVQSTVRFKQNIKNSILKDSCGCAMGARFSFLALIILIPYYWWRYEQHTISGSAAFLIALIAIFLISGFGKLIGILLNRALVRRKNISTEFQTK